MDKCKLMYDNLYNHISINNFLSDIDNNQDLKNRINKLITEYKEYNNKK